MKKFGNQINISKAERVTEENIAITRSFDCGNETLNDYLKIDAKDDAHSTVFMIIDKDVQSVIGYYSLRCSGFVINCNNHFTIYPAVEIKMFAIDEKYQHTSISDIAEEGTLSDAILAYVISEIYDFTNNYCGADKVILYSVPKAVDFYSKNGFKAFEEFMLKSESRFLDGCIPMYLDL